MNYNENNKKRKKSILLKILALIAVFALICGVAALVSSGILRDRNPDNLIAVDDTYVISRKLLYGVELDVKDDGTIKLKGETEKNEEILIRTVELDAGTYTISGIEKPNLGRMTLSAQWGNGNVAYAGLETDTFVLTEKTEVRIVLSIVDCEDGIDYVNRTIRPCLVAGDQPGDYYA